VCTAATIPIWMTAPSPAAISARRVAHAAPGSRPRRSRYTQAIEDLAGYVVRKPLSLKRLVYLDGQQAVNP
jgi:hypothetical protein